MAQTDNKDPNGKRQRGRPRAFTEKTEQNTIKSLDRAVLVLESLAKVQNATLSELSHSLKESPATVYRILSTFALHGIVESEAETQTWHIGPKAFLIGSVFLRRTSVVERSRPLLRALMETTGETANLGMQRDGAVLFVSQVETHAPIRAFFPPGTTSPLHASGIGKVLLAHSPEDQREDLIRRDLERFTEFTKTDVPELKTDMATILDSGYAVDNQERNLGMRCIAAPIRNAHNEVVAGISVSGPTSRVSTDKIEDLAAKVIAAAADVSADLGAPDNWS